MTPGGLAARCWVELGARWAGLVLVEGAPVRVEWWKAGVDGARGGAAAGWCWQWEVGGGAAGGGCWAGQVWSVWRGGVGGGQRVVVMQLVMLVELVSKEVLVVLVAKVVVVVESQRRGGERGEGGQDGRKQPRAALVGAQVAG